MHLLYHAKHPTFGLEEICPSLPSGMLKVPEFPGDYESVAEFDNVVYPALEDVYRASNNIEDAWSNNPGVRMLAEAPLRSTSTGDVVRLDDGSYHRCATVGWVEIEDPSPAAT